MGAGLCWGLWSHRRPACGPVWKDGEMAGKSHLLAMGLSFLSVSHRRGQVTRLQYLH